MIDYNNFEKYFISEKFKVVSEDVSFFFQNFKPATPIQDAKINEQTGQMLKLSIAGTCLGFALSLSLRRYLPNQFGELSLKRMIVDSTLVMGGYVYFSKMATYQVYQNLLPLRKELVEECNQDYLKHLLKMKQYHPQVYIKNGDIFKDIYNQKELKEWVDKNSSIAMIFGLQPHHFEGKQEQDLVQQSLTAPDAATQTSLQTGQSQQSDNIKNNSEKVYSFNFNDEQKKSKN